MAAVHREFSALSWALRSAGRAAPDLLDQAVVQARRAPLAYIKAGDRAAAAGQFERALAYFRHAAWMDKGNLDALKGEGLMLTALGRHGEAAEVYGQIVRADLADRTARYNFALACSRCGQLAQAQQAYVALLEIDPDHVQARYNLAGLYQLTGKLELSERQWREVVRRRPRSPSAQRSLGDVLMDQHRPAEAVEPYARAADLSPQDPWVWLELAGACAEAGMAGRAAVAADRAGRLAGHDAPLHRRLGQVYLDVYRLSHDGRFVASAVGAWQRSLQIDPSQADLRRLVRTYEAMATTTPASE